MIFEVIGGIICLFFYILYGIISTPIIAIASLYSNIRQNIKHNRELRRGSNQNKEYKVNNTSSNNNTNNNNKIKYTMKTFNAIQIVTALSTSPIWLNLLYTASFVGATPLFWVGCIVAVIFYIWAIIGVTETMGG